MIKVVFLILFFINSLFAMDLGFEYVYGKYTPSKEANATRQNYLGVRTNFYITPNIAISTQMDSIKKYEKNGTKVGSLTRYSSGIRWTFTNLDESFEPYLGLGVGSEFGVQKGQFYQFTMGAKYFVTTKFNILGEANYIKKKNKGQIYSMGLGLGYNFFRKPTISKYSESPIDEATMKKLLEQKADTNEDIFLSPY